MFKAALTGIGFTSENNAFIRYIESSCISVASSMLPLRKLYTISCVNFGAMFDKTDITPMPPRERIGTIWSSLPEYTCKFSRQSALISAIWDRFPLASFIATMLGIFDNSRQVSGNIFTPVRLGTLYKIIGSVVFLAISE